MSTGRLLMCTQFVAFLLLITIFPETCNPESLPLQRCPSSFCGNQNISHPFRLTTDPIGCGDLDYELSCETNNYTVIYFVIDRKYKYKYYVEAINYNNYTIRLVDPSYVHHKDTCSSIPLNPLMEEDFAFLFRYFKTEIMFGPVAYDLLGAKFKNRNLTETAIFLTCEKTLKNSHLLKYIDRATCINNSALSQSNRQLYSYVILDRSLIFSDLEESCHIDQIAIASNKATMLSSYRDVHNELAHGFELSWVQSFHKKVDDICYVEEHFNTVRCLSRLSRNICIIIVILIILIKKWRRRHLSMYNCIEEFLQSNNNLIPIRYSYKEIKKMTKGFTDKLGEGGFGAVYKGKLRSGRLVAVKMLGNSEGNGQDFINEVATIGRIHHVNVVRLIGFCVEGPKRALLYDFMPKGSLDKYVFSEELKVLGSEKMFEISLGIARGIEYLHRGCDMQILHFDIKPHNILLDENYIPKVSDFGLARLCPLKNSIVSLTAARGTMGYIAPELFYKNIGGVSYKADVYSFGMLLMEIASRRKNLNTVAEHSSQIYFPLWIYDQFNEGKEIEMEEVTEEELETVKKMIIVALWCIQLRPCDRPSMNRVIEMLEGEVEQLQMPPKPCFYPQESYAKDEGESSNTKQSSIPEDDSTEISLVLNAF
ncbi:hypothetical protein UlMin_003723 [Ulmus minor]